MTDTTPDHEGLTYRIGPEHINQRLDTYLASQIANWSRARLRRLIESEDVLVNGKPSKPAYKLRQDDEVDVELVAPESDRCVPEDIPLEIVYEDDTLIVVNKPAGLVVHPAAGIQSGTLVNALAFHFRQLPSGTSSSRPGIVHRLDRDTSGLLVVAKTEAALENLADQFRERKVYKSYVALVHGNVKTDSGRIEEPIARDHSNRTRMAVVKGGRSALSLFRVRRRYQRFTLLDVELKTGRTHQIRVHLAWIKHPVVGDETYGGGRDNTVQDARLRSKIKNLDRHFLHAEKLRFTHPVSNESMQFEATLPDDLQSFLTDLEVEERK